MRASVILFGLGALTMSAPAIQPAEEKAAKPAKATKPADGPWTELVKYEANHKGQTPFTVEAVDAYRYQNGKVIISRMQTKIAVQPGDKITFADGVTITVEKVKDARLQNKLGSLIDAPIPPPLKPGTVMPVRPVAAPVKKK